MASCVKIWTLFVEVVPLLGLKFSMDKIMLIEWEQPIVTDTDGKVSAKLELSWTNVESEAFLENSWA